MEFKYRDGQIRRTSTTPQCSLPPLTYVSRCPFRGGFPTSMLPSNVFPTTLPMTAQELRRRELEKEEIRREIIASEIARRRELEEEVRREMALERAMRIPIKQKEDITVLGGGSPFHLPSLSMPPKNNEDKVIILDKPDVNSCGVKRKALAPSPVDDSQHCSLGLDKKCKEWKCALCHITATSEKGLKDHLEGKKHKAKEVSLKTKKFGLVSRPDDQTLQPCITPADTGKLEFIEEDQAVHKCKDLSGLDNPNETTAGKDAGKTNALTTTKKFKFWCAFCQVGTRSEIVMQSHKNGKKHLANMNKLNQNNGAAANPTCYMSCSM